MSDRRPTLEGGITALLEYPAVDVEGDADLAEVLRFAEDLHRPSEENADRWGRYGRCRGCGQWWPCPPWAAASAASVEWLVLASNAVMRRSGTLGPALMVGGRPGREVELPECMLCRGPCAECAGGDGCPGGPGPPHGAAWRLRENGDG